MLVLTCSVHPEFIVANTNWKHSGRWNKGLSDNLNNRKKRKYMRRLHSPRLHEAFMGKTGPHSQIWGSEKYSGIYGTNLLSLSSRRH